jgi:hypothetical protein
MGELAGWMDENFIRTIFSSAMNENVQVKIIRDRHSGYVSLLCLSLSASISLVTLTFSIYTDLSSSYRLACY